MKAIRSIRARVTALFSLFVALLMGASGAAVQHREERRAEKRAREILAVAVERARDEVDETDEPGATPRTLLEVTKTDSNEIAAGGLSLLVAKDNRIVWRSRRHAPDWPRVGENWRVAQISKNGQTLILAHDWAPVADDLRETARALWQLGFLIVVATTTAAWLVVGRTLSPLDRLANQAQDASIEGLAVRLKAPSSDSEMLHLTRTLNSLLERLEREAQTRGRFYMAASHELRTPIQALLGEVEVTLARPRSGPFYREALEQVHDETKRLKTLTQDLLQLNALEMRQVQADCETLDLPDRAQRVLMQQRETIGARALNIETRFGEAEIEAPPAHLDMLLRNLLENAVKYAAPGGAIKLETGAQNGAQLRVWNVCHIPENTDLTDWFEPFYRPDEARNSQNGGNGLGLSIVTALARANNWKIELSQSDGGVLAQVWFAPRAS